MTRSTRGDFDFLSRLGKGSFGAVYKVRRKKDKKIYALKKIDLSAMTPEEKDAAAREAIQEAHIMSKIRSPFVVGYRDAFFESDALHIVMDYCDRGDLQNVLKRCQEHGPLPEDRVWSLFLKITLGLNHLHRQKILHRDLKSANVLLAKNDQVRLGDLGVAKVLTTQTNFAKTLVGTPYYLSPELCENKEYNEKSDVWALGCVLYECCTLKHPFDANNQGALVLKIVRGKYDRVTGYSRSLSRLVDRLLQRDKRARPDTEEILSQLPVQQAAKRLGIAIPDHIPVARKPKPSLPSEARGRVPTSRGRQATSRGHRSQSRPCSRAPEGGEGKAGPEEGEAAEGEEQRVRGKPPRPEQAGAGAGRAESKAAAPAAHAAGEAADRARRAAGARVRRQTARSRGSTPGSTPTSSASQSPRPDRAALAGNIRGNRVRGNVERQPPRRKEQLPVIQGRTALGFAPVGSQPRRVQSEAAPGRRPSRRAAGRTPSPHTPSEEAGQSPSLALAGNAIHWPRRTSSGDSAAAGAAEKAPAPRPRGSRRLDSGLVKAPARAISEGGGGGGRKPTLQDLHAAGMQLSGQVASVHERPRTPSQGGQPACLPEAEGKAEAQPAPAAEAKAEEPPGGMRRPGAPRRARGSPPARCVARGDEGKEDLGAADSPPQGEEKAAGSPPPGAGGGGHVSPRARSPPPPLSSSPADEVEDEDEDEVEEAGESIAEEEEGEAAAALEATRTAQARRRRGRSSARESGEEREGGEEGEEDEPWGLRAVDDTAEAVASHNIPSRASAAQPVADASPTSLSESVAAGAGAGVALHDTNQAGAYIRGFEEDELEDEDAFFPSEDEADPAGGAVWRGAEKWTQATSHASAGWLGDAGIEYRVSEGDGSPLGRGPRPSGFAGAAEGDGEEEEEEEEEEYGDEGDDDEGDAYGGEAASTIRATVEDLMGREEELRDVANAHEAELVSVFRDVLGSGAEATALLERLRPLSMEEQGQVLNEVEGLLDSGFKLSQLVGWWSACQELASCQRQLDAAVRQDG